jgi:hypothetical protein
VAFPYRDNDVLPVQEEVKIIDVNRIVPRPPWGTGGAKGGINLPGKNMFSTEKRGYYFNLCPHFLQYHLGSVPAFKSITQPPNSIFPANQSSRISMPGSPYFIGTTSLELQFGHCSGLFISYHSLRFVD